MAGHSQFANIKHRKAGKDAKRAKLFTKLTREIQVAASSGSADPDFNPRLRNALILARKNGVPKDRIEMAVKKATSGINTEHFEEVRYEGYALGGIAIIVDALSDNRNRTASDVRTAFTKYSGALGETGCVNFMFDRIGYIEYKNNIASNDEIFESAVEAGVQDVESQGEYHYISCSPEDFMKVRDILAKKYGEPESAKLIWKPKDPMIITEKEIATTLLKLIDALEDSDDVQEVTGNFIISSDLLEQIDI